MRPSLRLAADKRPAPPQGEAAPFNRAPRGPPKHREQRSEADIRWNKALAPRRRLRLRAQPLVGFTNLLKKTPEILYTEEQLKRESGKVNYVPSDTREALLAGADTKAREGCRRMQKRCGLCEQTISAKSLTLTVYQTLQRTVTASAELVFRCSDAPGSEEPAGFDLGVATRNLCPLFLSCPCKRLTFNAKNWLFLVSRRLSFNCSGADFLRCQRGGSCFSVFRRSPFCV